MIGILVCLFDQPITLVPAQFDYAMYEKKRNGIYIYDGKRINKTKQIVISGLISSARSTENWAIYKLN